LCDLNLKAGEAGAITELKSSSRTSWNIG